MKKLFPFSLLLLIILCGCNLNPKGQINEDTGSVVLVLKNDAAKYNQFNSRTISPETSDGFSYKNVEYWNVKFTSEKYSTNTYFTPEPNEEFLSVVLPVGNYSISMEGTVSISPQGSGTRIYTYYGSVSNVDITTGNSKQIEIDVGLKKTSDGIGHLDYTLTLGDAFSADCEVTPKLYGLSSWNSGELVAENWVNLTKEFDADTKTLTFNVQNAPSGYYRLEVTYQETGSDTVLNLVLSDNIVEISDGSRTIASDTTNSYKLIREYWATKEASSSNGLTKDYPANITTLLSKLKSDTEWDEANIYFEKGQKASGITISAADFSGRSVNIYYGEMAFIKNNQFVNTYYVDASGSYTTISGTQTVKAFKTLNDVAALIDAVDYSEQAIVYIQINGHINETKPSTFSKVSSICINGAHGCSAVYNPNSSVAQDESKYNDSSKILNDFENDMDVLDFGNINNNYGIDITNIKGSVIVSDLAIVNANSFDGVNVCGQNGGLRLEYGNNTEEKSIKVEGCYFKNNTGGSVGQSILLIGFNNVQANEVAAKAPKVDIKRCVFTECGKKGEDDSFKGGVINARSGVTSVVIDNCRFDNNYSPDICIDKDTSNANCEVTVKNTLFATNNYTSSVEKNANISYQNGQLNIGGGNKFSETGSVIICMYTEGTINVIDRMAESDLADYKIKSVKYEQYSSTQSYERTADLLKVTVPSGSTAFTVEDVKSKFTLMDVESSVSDLSSILTSISFATGATSALNPIRIIITDIDGDDATATGTNIEAVRTALLNTQNVYVNLDISGNSLTEFTNSHDFTDKGNTAITGGCGFSNAANLVEIDLPNNFSTIGKHAFSGCTNLRRVGNLNNVITIGEKGFYYCENLGSMEFTVLTQIGSHAFMNSGIESITLPEETFESIGTNAFQNVTRLKTIEIPSQVTGIPEYCFADSKSIETVIINGSEVNIAYYAFRDCEKLKKVIFKGTKLKFGGGADAFGVSFDKFKVVGNNISCFNELAATFGTKYPNYTSCFVPSSTASAVGDIALADGSFIPSGALSAYSDYFSFTPVGVVCDYDELTDEESGVVTKSGKILGLNLSEQMAWAAEGTTGATTKITTEGSTGKEQWEGIKTADSEGTSEANLQTNYPAFYYASVYGATNNFTGSYAADWYIPCREELVNIRNNKAAISSSLALLPGNPSFKDQYWTSTQNGDADAAYYVKINDSYEWDYQNKKETGYVLVIHSF